MASSENRDIADYCDHIVDAAMMETEFKKDKARAKSIKLYSIKEQIVIISRGTSHAILNWGSGCLSENGHLYGNSNGSDCEVFGFLYQT